VFVSGVKRNGCLLFAFGCLWIAPLSVAMAQNGEPQFGILGQKQVRVPGNVLSGSKACVPTASANALRRLQYANPDLFGQTRLLVPGEEDDKSPRLTANWLASLMETTDEHGTAWENGTTGLEKFLEVQGLLDRTMVNESIDPSLQQILLTQMVGGVIVLTVDEIEKRGFEPHALTYTGFTWNLQNDLGRPFELGPLDELTFHVVDPGGDVAKEKDIEIRLGSGNNADTWLESNYFTFQEDGTEFWNAKITGMYAIIPVRQAPAPQPDPPAATPEPATWLLGLTGLAAVIGSQTWRKRNLKAPV
jgi:hypothetical protein